MKGGMGSVFGAYKQARNKQAKSSSKSLWSSDQVEVREDFFGDVLFELRPKHEKELPTLRPEEGGSRGREQ